MATKQYYYDWMRGWVVGRRGDPPGLPLPARQRPFRDADDDRNEREHRDEGGPLKLHEGRLHPQGGQ